MDKLLEFDWESHGIVADHHKFFCSRWYELFSEETFDSWQVRYANIYTLIREFQQAVKTAKAYPPSAKNLPGLAEEISKQFSSDIVLKRYFTACRIYSKDLEKLCKQKKENNKSCDLENESGTDYVYKDNLYERMVSVSKVLEGGLKGYRSKLLEGISGILEKDPKELGQYKEELYQYTTALATQYKRRGVSSAALKELFMTMESHEDPFHERVVKSLEQFDGPWKEFECYVGCEGSSFLTKAIKHSFKTLSKEEMARILEDASVDIKLTNDLYVVVKVSTLDFIAAARNAKKTLATTCSITYTASYETHIEFSDVILVKTDDTILGVEPNNGLNKNYRMPTNPLKTVATTQKVLSSKKRHQSDKSKLRSSLHHYQLAMKSADQHARFFNCWVALEVLASTESGSVISCINSWLPKVMATSYANRMTSYATKMIQPLWRDHDTENLRQKCVESSEFTLHRKDFFKIMTWDVGISEDMDTDIKDFSAIFKNDPLYVYRNDRVRKILSTSGRLAERIAKHERDVELHIERLYRTRNLIVHMGGRVLNISMLCQHLQSYYLTLLGSVIHDLSKNRDWGLYESHIYRTHVHDNYKKALKDTKAISLDAQFVLHPEDHHGLPDNCY